MTAPSGDGVERPPAEPPRVRRAKRAPGRLAPEALAAARGDAREGLDWLGREPESRASLLYRVIMRFARIVLFGLFRFRLDVTGRELLPKAGGYTLIAAAHRGWMDPLVVMFVLPVEPRAWFLGSGPSSFGSRWRERFLRRVGGLLPVWRGGVGIDQHLRAARAVIANGGVFAQMPEGTVSGPAGMISRFRIGAALIALRLDCPIVLLAVAGTEELYVGRRMAARVLPPTTVTELMDEGWDGVRPPPGSRAELELAHRLTERFEERLGPVVTALHPSTVDPAGHPRRLRSRLTWLLLRKGRLDREAAEDA